jgi:hypothetical protein
MQFWIVLSNKNKTVQNLMCISTTVTLPMLRIIMKSPACNCSYIFPSRHSIIKQWYGSESQEYFRLLDLFGVTKPAQRNWFVEDKVLAYITAYSHHIIFTMITLTIFTLLSVYSTWVKLAEKDWFHQFLVNLQREKILLKIKQIKHSHIMGVLHFCCFGSVGFASTFSHFMCNEKFFIWCHKCK